MKTRNTHPFEIFGAGPYKFVGYRESVYQACQGAPVQPAGSCDCCGQGIRHCFRFASADGTEFTVGCDCAEKAGRDYGQECKNVLRDRKRSAADNARRAEAAARKAKREAEVAPKRDRLLDAFGERLAALNGVAGFPGKFAADLAFRINNGYEPSEKQVDLLNRLVREQQPTGGGYVGTLNERVTVEVEILRTIWLDAYCHGSATPCLFILATAKGERVVWKTTAYVAVKDSEGKRAAKVGDKLTLTGTVKSHALRDGTPQTTLTRCKVR